MTKTLGLNSNNDIYIGTDGNLVVLNDLRAVIGACETASKAQLGEMVLAIAQGIPTFQTVWIGSPNYAIFQSYLRATLLAVPGVLEVKSIKISADNNIMSYDATIQSQYGTAVING